MTGNEIKSGKMQFALIIADESPFDFERDNLRSCQRFYSSVY